MKRLLHAHQPVHDGFVEHVHLLSDTQINAYWDALHDDMPVNLEAMERDAKMIQTLLIAEELQTMPKQGNWIHTLLTHLQRESYEAQQTAKANQITETYWHLYEIQHTSRTLLHVLSFKQEAPWITILNIIWGLGFLIKWLW